jgi:hypothetical protein
MPGRPSRRPPGAVARPRRGRGRGHSSAPGRTADHPLERPPERARELRWARRRVVGVDLEAQQGVDVDGPQFIQRPIHRPHDAPRGGLRRCRSDLLPVGIPRGRPAGPPHGHQLRGAQQELPVHRGPYRRLLLYHAGLRRHFAFDDADAARRYFQTHNPKQDSHCPSGREGHGVRIFGRSPVARPQPGGGASSWFLLFQVMG